MIYQWKAHSIGYSHAQKHFEFLHSIPLQFDLLKETPGVHVSLPPVQKRTKKQVIFLLVIQFLHQSAYNVRFLGIFLEGNFFGRRKWYFDQ